MSLPSRTEDTYADHDNVKYLKDVLGLTFGILATVWLLRAMAKGNIADVKRAVQAG